MKKLILSALCLFALVSCGEKTKEEIITDEFEKYVETDFDDPSEYVEITSIEPVDTLNRTSMNELIRNMEGSGMLMFKYQREKLDELKSQLADDKTFIVTYELKVRTERNGRKRVVNYYVIDDGYEYKVQDHKMKIEEAPELYEDILEFAKDLIRGL